MQGISIPMLCTERVFPDFYGNPLVYSSTLSLPNTMEWSIERRVFPGVESK
jgi:hypothetical protein